ncbi:MAG: hypothetical protein QOI10_2381 [Solirubrobacterales bacterium]|nr:hypothetical protein [Solirubrobacterales bacterium]
MAKRTAGLAIVVFALAVIGASAVSFAGQASEGDVGRQLVGAYAWGKPRESVRDDVYDKLKSVPGGPYHVKRGGTVQLDGSASKPKKKITSYTWTFIADCPGDVPADPVFLSGAKVKLVAVCDTKANLTVSDGQTSDTATAKIKVGGNLKDLKFHQSPDAATGNFPFDTSLGTFVFGFNRCAIEWGESHDPELVDHWIHKPDGGDDVDTQRVHDPGGPYNGFFYVTGHNLKVTRQMIINAKLLPGGSVYQLNDDSGPHKQAIENIAEATLDHERIHGELVAQKLKSKKLKFLDELAKAVDTSEEGLQNRADAIIVGGETELKNASTESKVHGQMAKKWGAKQATILRPSDGSSFTYTLANIGDL